jgi:two-component system sensor histidine kinase UhpB
MKKELDIIIIEDVVRDAEAIEAELREARLPFTSRRLESAEALRAELERSVPDIILSDFTLPQFDALGALRLLKERRLDIPFILVTGNRSEEVAVECIQQGADDYILKASLKRLPTSIKNAIQKKAIEQAKAHAELALRRSEEKYRLIAHNTRDVITMVDADGRFTYVSPSVHASLGFVPEELVGTDALELVHPEDRSGMQAAWEQSLAHQESRTAEVRMRHRNGEWRFFESVGSWIFDEQTQPQNAVFVNRDATRRKASEAALRELPRLIREAQEAERHRVARELHDSVNQILSSVKFRLQAVEGKLTGANDAASREVLKAKEHLEKAIQEVRRISRNLRPSELDDFGLAPALRSLCSEFGERTGMEIDLAISRLPQTIPDDIELNLYRIIQEALGNIEKHSRATQVTLRLVREGTLLKAAIRDNGRGFDAAALEHRKSKYPGMGLVDMKERAAFVGGAYSVRSARGEGTEIVIEMPLRIVEHSRSKQNQTTKSPLVPK